MTRTPRPTWRQLVEREPLLEELRAQAEAVTDSGADPWFCANGVWYREFKPVLVRLVGWSRGRTDADLTDRLTDRPGRLMTMDEVRAVAATEIRVLPPDELLDSSAAYDVAYQTIYDWLPDCRGCSCL